MADTYDLIVLGSGPGGYVAAIRAAQLGLKTAIVERETARRHLPQLGLHPDQGAAAHGRGVPLHDPRRRLWPQQRQAVVRHRQGRRAQPRGGQAAQPGRHAPDEEEQDRGRDGRGQAHRQRQAVSVTGADGKATELAAKHIIVATGARARDLPFAKADGKRIWTYRHAMTPPEMPTELLVIGSGAIGIEFASFYADLGAKVTVVEMLDRVVPVEDAEVSAQLAKSLQKQGLTILTSAGRREPDRRRQGRHRQDQDQRRQVGRTSLQPLHRRRRYRPQHREYRARGARRENDQGSHRHRPDVPHQCARHLGDRRRHRAAVARAQGEPRRRHRRRGDRAGARQQGRASARHRPEEHPRLHLLSPAGRERRPHRSHGERRRATRSRSENSRRSATARRSRSARSKASSRPCSTPRPANCSART